MEIKVILFLTLRLKSYLIKPEALRQHFYLNAVKHL